MIKIEIKDKDSQEFTPVDYDNIRSLQKKDAVGDSEEYETTLGEQATNNFISDEIFEDLEIVEDKATIPDLEEIKKMSSSIIEKNNIIPDKPVEPPPVIPPEVIENEIILDDEDESEDLILDDDMSLESAIDTVASEIKELPVIDIVEQTIEVPIEQATVPPIETLPDKDIEPVESKPEPSFRDHERHIKTTVESIERIYSEHNLDPLDDDREFLNRDEVVYDGSLNKEEIKIVHKTRLSGGIIFLITLLTSLVVLSMCVITYLLFFSMDSKQTQYISDMNVNLQQLNNISDTERIAIDSYVSGLSSKEDLITLLNGINSSKKNIYAEVKKIEVPKKNATKQIHSLAEGIFVTSLNATAAIFSELENSDSNVANILNIYNKYVELFNSNVYLYNTYIKSSLNNKSILGG